MSGSHWDGYQPTAAHPALCEVNPLTQDHDHYFKRQENHPVTGSLGNHLVCHHHHHHVTWSVNR
jgi:hypothetical protein